MFSTPNYSHLKNFPNVYDPCEDTFLLLDALEVDFPSTLSKLNPSVVVEVGTGSGIVINFLSKLFTQSVCIGTDINREACEAARQTSQLNSNDCRIEIINCDLVSVLADRLEGEIDVLVFNPPYVVTEKDELGSNSIEAAWAGGHSGRQVMDRLFPQLNRLLSPNGIFYLVCIKPNNIDEIESILANYGFSMQVVLNRKAGIENLFILRFKRK